jgi:hypothetical protein
VATFPELEQTMRVWVGEAAARLSEGPEPDISPGLRRWQRDSDGSLRERERPVRVWRHAEVEAVRLVPDPEATRPLPGMVELLGPWPPGSWPWHWSPAARPPTWPSMPPRPGCAIWVLYGLEEIRDGQVRVDPRLEAGRPAVEAAHQGLREHPAVRDSRAWLGDLAALPPPPSSPPRAVTPSGSRSARPRHPSGCSPTSTWSWRDRRACGTSCSGSPLHPAPRRRRRARDLAPAHC